MIRRIVLVALFGLLCNPLLFSQDSTAVEDLNEQKELKFQQYFFKALSEKAIKNYQNAIESLEFCNELIPNNTAVLFEFSKNYYLLNQFEPAKLYVNNALNIEPNNIWMLSHLVEIHKKERDYVSGINILKKIIPQNPKKKEDLVRLYYLNRQYEEAISLLQDIEKEQGLSRNLKSLKRSLEFRKGTSVTQKTENLVEMISEFEKNSSFELLKKILEKSFSENLSIFHKYAEQAMDLYPAQPFAYLTQGRSLKIQNKTQEALVVLESGIDFVIENPKLEAQFYIELAKVHDALGNISKAQEFRNKAKKLNLLK